MEKLLYRWCCGEEVKNFLKNNHTESISCDYVSLTKNLNEDVFGSEGSEREYLLTFNADMIYQQGGFDVVYTKEALQANDEIFRHICKSLDIDTIEESVEYGFTEDDYYNYVIENLQSEEEVLIKYITLTKGLLISIDKYSGVEKINISKIN